MNDMWKFNDKDEQLLKDLCGSCGPTSYEVEIQKLMASSFEGIGISCTGDAIGNLYAQVNPEADFNIAIVAHADEIGIQINEITSEGLLKFRKLGGVRCTSLIGQRVNIMTPEGLVPGVVGSDPLKDNGTETGILLKTSDLWVDIGAESMEEACRRVPLGSFGVFDPDYFALNTNRRCSKAFDDRLGLFVMFKAFEILSRMDLSISVTAISSVQEEISMLGASACNKNFNAAIILDVDFATDIPSDHPEMGLLKLGSGIGINKNADSNHVLQKIFKNVMDNHSLPYQETLSRNISGGTDATRLHSSGDIATLNMNIPLRYMHSRYEICDLRDVECAVEAVVALIKYLNDNKIKSFIPWKNL